MILDLVPAEPGAAPRDRYAPRRGARHAQQRRDRPPCVNGLSRPPRPHLVLGIPIERHRDHPRGVVELAGPRRRTSETERISSVVEPVHRVHRGDLRPRSCARPVTACGKTKRRGALARVHPPTRDIRAIAPSLKTGVARIQAMVTA